MHKSLADLKTGEKGAVVTCNGGHQMARRLEGMGIRPGVVVSRVSAQFMAGPITVSVNGRLTAMGRGIASKILVGPVPAASPKP